jgi:hypothetical protein
VQLQRFSQRVQQALARGVVTVHGPVIRPN